MKAYIKTDPLELPEALEDLERQLNKGSIEALRTDKDWREIKETEPFLYYRNAYLRFNNPSGVLNFHYQNRHIPYLSTTDNELISVNNNVNIKDHHFLINQESYYFQPMHSPLPILLGTHRRPYYLWLTLNSLFYNLKDSRQKIYIVASDPDPETFNILMKHLDDPRIEVVKTDNNLKYSFANFGSKFFGLAKFIHFEDDGILPENTHHFYPYWPSQLNYRSTTADYTTLCVQEYLTTSLLKSTISYRAKGLLKIPANTAWLYTERNPDQIIPSGGLGLVIDSAKSYRNFIPPNYNKTDNSLLSESKKLCLCNLPIYHIGSNQKMDYPIYVNQKKTLMVGRIQSGLDLKSGKFKEIDLQSDWTLV